MEAPSDRGGFRLEVQLGRTSSREGVIESWRLGGGGGVDGDNKVINVVLVAVADRHDHLIILTEERTTGLIIHPAGVQRVTVFELNELLLAAPGSALLSDPADRATDYVNVRYTASTQDTAQTETCNSNPAHYPHLFHCSM